MNIGFHFRGNGSLRGKGNAIEFGYDAQVGKIASVMLEVKLVSDYSAPQGKWYSRHPEVSPANSLRHLVDRYR